MPIHIEGKDLPIGKYDFHRYMTYNGEKQKINTYGQKKYSCLLKSFTMKSVLIIIIGINSEEIKKEEVPN